MLGTWGKHGRRGIQAFHWCWRFPPSSPPAADWLLAGSWWQDGLGASSHRRTDMRLSLPSSLQLHIFFKKDKFTLYFNGHVAVLFIFIFSWISLSSWDISWNIFWWLELLSNIFTHPTPHKATRPFLDAQVLPVSVSLSSLHFCTLLTWSHDRSATTSIKFVASRARQRSADDDGQCLETWRLHLPWFT